MKLVTLRLFEDAQEHSKTYVTTSSLLLLLLLLLLLPLLLLLLLLLLENLFSYCDIYFGRTCNVSGVPAGLGFIELLVE